MEDLPAINAVVKFRYGFSEHTGVVIAHRHGKAVVEFDDECSYIAFFGNELTVVEGGKA